MPGRLQTYLPVLKKLKRCGKKERKKILSKADNGLIECLCDCAHNTLNKNIPLTSNQFKKLSRHKKILRSLASKKVSIKKKKSVIVRQCGGFLLPLLAPILGAILQGLVG
jgi:hypothetical protein